MNSRDSIPGLLGLDWGLRLPSLEEEEKDGEAGTVELRGHAEVVVTLSFFSSVRFNSSLEITRNRIIETAMLLKMCVWQLRRLF